MSNRMYVACLAAYNTGHLHGCWVEATPWLHPMQKQVDAMLASSPAGDDAEEYAIHDHEMPFPVGEYTPLEDVADGMEALESLTERDQAAFAAWLDHEGETTPTGALVARFEEAYQGEYSSELGFAHDWVDALGVMDDAPALLQSYFDYESYARDLFLCDLWSTSAPNGGVFVFRRI